ncbi:hypothetical protein H310_00128 [Aphanomyces invadans]|uniref:Uncharacterized protein n=1 Tax=Aphanomyces invadans TaxID=157072 RepID=A0A024UST1_9STRA|nr:hypothetical protein H310_00128 [Aphanomyces invadans]ETW09581.1 hypothetical protein H310_00128 [Aphanomyces invadans]|eukprot:XP_008860992.1 hypothetical protein H310_00128 [Aphanomyces invadans]
MQLQRSEVKVRVLARWNALTLRFRFYRERSCNGRGECDRAFICWTWRSWSLLQLVQRRCFERLDLSNFRGSVAISRELARYRALKGHGSIRKPEVCSRFVHLLLQRGARCARNFLLASRESKMTFQ